MGINGKVLLTVTTVDGDDAEDVPTFENKAKSLTYALINGETLITVSVWMFLGVICFHLIVYNNV